MHSKVMKKLVVITSDLYVRNYIQSNALHLIQDEHCYFIASSQVSLKQELEALPNFLGFFEYGNDLHQKYMYLSNVLMLRHQNRSKTFKFRFRRRAWQVWDQLAEAEVLKSKTYRALPRVLPKALRLGWARLNQIKKMKKNDKKTLKMWVLGRPVLAELFVWNFQRNIKPNPMLKEMLEAIRPDLVIFPSTAIDAAGNDLIRLQRPLNYKTLFLIDNWDNLSSKSVFMRLPDYIGVWGTQGKEHAINIHGFSPNQICEMGTPRFEPYYKTVETYLNTGERPSSPYAFPYILYVGCCIPFDEMTSLKMLDQALIQYNQNRAEPVYLVYRPHPWRIKRACPDRFEQADFRYVQLDEQLKEQYYTPQATGLFQPSLDYYPRLLMNALSVVGPLTTMLIEAAIFRKKILAFAYDDGVHMTSPSHALENYLHFEGITEIPHWYFAKELQQLQDTFLAFISNDQEQVDWEAQKGSLGYYLHHDDRAYAERLKDFVSQIQEGETWAMRV
ncbi:hypothetical protein [Vampirovibrio sp.]|uniref:hypothetical protein n=1 Tax=Vampirovibrio sp. TaxID=2717857 RepID=UPI003593CDD9